MKTPVQYIVIEEDFAGQRIDNFLITRLKSVPRTRIYRLLRKGEVRVNKKRIDPSYRIQSGDEVRLPPVELEVKPVVVPNQRLITLLNDRIIYEDKNLLIINKPSGIAVHGGSGVPMGVVETLQKAYPKLPHLELAHRLDADTSGCLVLAKKRSILKEVHELLREGRVRKIYYALTKGQWKPDDYRVEVPLRKNMLSSGERIVRVDAGGKPSLTVFEPIQHFKNSNATLVEATLHTGRTHQIRVHCQYRGHPIAGDEKYGDKTFNKEMREHSLKRLFLHAKLVEFALSNGDYIKVEAPLDVELAKCLRVLERDT